jgi:predicted ester cyclase
MSLYQNAHAFFEACETGQGWNSCEAFCHADASFACQADALAETTILAAYADWMKGHLTPVPDGRYVMKAFAVDEARNAVVAAAEFHGTQTGEGGPVAPTGKTYATVPCPPIQEGNACCA